VAWTLLPQLTGLVQRLSGPPQLLAGQLTAQVGLWLQYDTPTEGRCFAAACIPSALCLEF
jgi:hypothetical protein